MAFPDGWGRKCALVIQSSKVSATLSNFPVLLTKVTLPSEMFDHDGSYSALEGGGDIRFSSDDAGSSQLACDIVVFSLDDADDEAQIYVSVTSIAHDADTTIYVWYDKDGESQPAVDAAYGRNATWDANFKGVWHLEEQGDGSSDEYVDSSGTGDDGTGGSGAFPAQTTGQIGSGQDFDGSDDYITIASAADHGTTALSVTVWIKPDSTSGGLQRVIADSYYGLSGWRFGIQDDDMNVSISDGTENICETFNLIDTNWQHIGFTFSQPDIKVFRNGAKIPDEDVFNETWDNAIAQSTADLIIGRNSSATQWFIGLVDEIRLSNSERSEEWIGAEYENINDPNAFVVEGTPESTVSDLTIDVSECE